MEKVRFGIIGVGNQGRSYIVNIFEKGLVENGYLTAVCDINPARLDAVREKLGDEVEINLQNASVVKERGANVLVAGSAVFGAEDVAATVREFLK